MTSKLSAITTGLFAQKPHAQRATGGPVAPPTLRVVDAGLTPAQIRAQAKAQAAGKTYRTREQIQLEAAQKAEVNERKKAEEKLKKSEAKARLEAQKEHSEAELKEREKRAKAELKAHKEAQAEYFKAEKKRIADSLKSIKKAQKQGIAHPHQISIPTSAPPSAYKVGTYQTTQQANQQQAQQPSYIASGGRPEYSGQHRF